MPTPAWPATLPVPNLPGYGVDPASAVVRTDFEAGRARQRQRFTQVPEVVTATFRFTPAQMAIFRAFWKVDLANGSKTLTVNLDIGTGIVSHAARFVPPYRANALPAMNWEVTCKLEVLDA